MLLRKIFGPKRVDVTGDWKRLPNEQFHILYSLPNVIRIIISRRMGYVWRVAYMGEQRNAHRLLVGNLRERDHLENLGIDGRIMLK